MNEEKQVAISAIPPTERHGYHSYTVTSTYSKDVLTLSVQELLELAAWVNEQKTELGSQAKADEERNQRAWDADMNDLEHIARAWYASQHQGDENASSSPAM